jgi:hypothetical protein
LFNRRIAGLATDFHEIRLWNMRRSFGQRVRQLAIVGEQQEPFTGIIQSAYRVHALLHAVQEIDNRWTAFGIAQGCDVALRLVEKNVDVVA